MHYNIDKKILQGGAHMKAIHDALDRGIAAMRICAGFKLEEKWR